MKSLLTIVLSLLFVFARAKESPSSSITLDDFKLVGDLSGARATFTLTATAHVAKPHDGALDLLRGPVALTEIHPHPRWHVQAEGGGFRIQFDRAGDFPIQINFEAAVTSSNGWNEVNFGVAGSSLQPISLRGLPADTQFEFAGAARPERQGGEFVSYLAGNGEVKLRWKEARPETEGKLFYAAEMLSQVSVSPGLLRQTALLDFKVMQGELNRVTLLLRGPGEVTHVQGEQVLAWNLEPVPNSSDRRLLVQFNQPQKDQFTLQVQTQTALGAFPQTADVLQLRPESATRFAGYFRVVNEGAVRLEVAQANGLSQISPEQFPENEHTRAFLRPTGSQRFAYRFSGGDFALRIQADQILPEIGVSEVLSYHLGENELSIDGEFELDIREAPLRELTLRIPKGYSIARLSAAGLSDYFTLEPDQQPEVDLRLVFAQPISGRQLVQLRLERNKALSEATWAIPRIEIPKAKSVRGHIAAGADAGFRMTSERTQGLTEIATAFFPRKVASIQSAFRLSEPAWQASFRIERLPQTVQADVLHLFSVGEGIAYGSSVINYVVSGAPVSVFKIELSEEYFNVEFTGKDIRNWQKVAGGYQVQLHTPISGSYTLLATYERPFKPQGETLTFTGARPLDAQSEQGHTLVISAYQFQVQPVDVSGGLLPLEPGEVPAEYRLFFDAPILAAYSYAARPFNLKLALSPLSQGDSLSLVVDRASLTTRISKEGQLLTDARYFVKNRGNPHFRLTLPTGTRLWSATVNGASVVPVTDANSDLIPLPQGGDPNSVLTLDLKLAAVSKDPGRVHVAAPIVNAPVMLAEWKLTPDAGQRLVYGAGSLTPSGGEADASGFAQLVRAANESEAGQSQLTLCAMLALAALALVSWYWAGGAAAKLNPRHLAGLLVGVSAMIVALVLLGGLASQFKHQQGDSVRDLAFLAPVQQAGSALSLEILNVEDKTSPLPMFRSAWPALLSLLVWAVAWNVRNQIFKHLMLTLGWVLLGWAALRSPYGANVFLIVIAAFLLVHLALPALVRCWRLPPPQPGLLPSKPATGVAAASLALLVGASLALSSGTSLARSTSPPPESNIADRVNHEIRIEDKFVFGHVKIHWQAEKGQVLPLLFEPAVLTHIGYPAQELRLEQEAALAQPETAVTGTSQLPTQQLVAKRGGAFDLELQYELPVIQRNDENGFYLPVQSGLINRLSLSLVSLDVDVSSPAAVSVHREVDGSNTVARLVLSPACRIWVGWKPRNRDVKLEKSVFYAELSHLYAPMAGVIEGEHVVALRLAQGQLSELVFNIPIGITITDVLEAAGPGTATNTAKASSAPIVSVWRFDPDTRKLRVTLSPAQSRSFTLRIKSQAATGPLPFEQSLGLISVLNAAEQIGLVGLATGNDVQLDSARTDALSPINLEDFPQDMLANLQTQIAGLTLRRAFRYANPAATVSLKASPVEPDVHVDSQDTVSLGEDRVVLAANSTVVITRAGIFHLSFLMPAGFEVESISGSALSHWTESSVDTNRIVTLHLNGKTEGQQQFAISLAGPGTRAAKGWTVPQLDFREASKHTGTLLLVPEQGLRLQLASSDGLTQLDPQKSGIKQKGVLAFRALQTSRSLVLNLELVDSWIQVSSLQHAAIGEALVKIAANLEYQIENTGLKSFHVLIPTNAEGLRFQGEQVADFLPIKASVTNGLQSWEIRLHRRVIGSYLLQVSYQIPVPDNASEIRLKGVQATDVNLQRGYVTVQSGGRLQVRIDSTPAALQPAEWQSIPRALQQGLQASAANFSYRLVEPAFELPLRLERYKAAQLLPGRVNSITFNSVISDDGVMLTQARVEMFPGQKRLLRLTLPQDAHFWFAFVNQNGVWPWREQDQILIPLEQQALGDKLVPVELFYTCKIGTADRHSLDLELLAPKFDLPLENITWRVSLSDKWQLKKWSGSLQLQNEEVIRQAAVLDVARYLEGETLQQQQRTKEAENLLAVANSALAQGEPQQARRAFQSAYGLSAHDAAFNEDARVQLHNIKLQEALVGLNVRQATSSGDTGALGGKLRELKNRKEANYTQQDAKDIIERNTSDENAAFMRLAERLIQQQDAAATAPAALHASIPEQGRVLTFKRAVLVDPWSALRIDLKAGATAAATWTVRGAVLAAMFLLMAGLAWLAARRPESLVNP
jgi:hypothetical protein